METIEYIKAKSDINKADITHISELLFNNIFIKNLNYNAIKESEVFTTFFINALENMLFMTNTLSKADKIYLMDILNKVKLYDEHKQLAKISTSEFLEIKKLSEHLSEKSQSAFHGK